MTRTVGSRHQRRHVTRLAGCLLALPLWFSADGADRAAAASGWAPAKNVELVAPGNPGDSVDRTLRLVQSIFQEGGFGEFTSTVVNKPGGGQSVSWAYLDQHPGDGHYLGITSPSLLIRRITGQSSVVAGVDVVPVALLLDDYSAAVVRADSPVTDGQDLIRRLQADPTSLSVAISPGLGSPNHIAMGLALGSGDVDLSKLRIAVFTGSSKSVAAVLGGHADLSFLPTSTALPHLQAGTLRVLAVSSPQRLDGAFAEVPTWKEAGADFSFANWRAIIAPRDTPADQIAFWEAAFEKVSETPAWKEDLDKNLWTPNYLGSADTLAFMEAQYLELDGVLRKMGLAK